MMFKLRSVPVLAALSVAVLLAVSPAAKAKSLKPGAYMAMGETCGVLLTHASPRLLEELLRPGSQFGYEMLDTLIERAYASIDMILAASETAEDEPVGGDRPWGFARLAAFAIVALPGARLDPGEVEQPGQEILIDMYKACKKTMRTGTLHWPSGYPFSTDD